jgi:hypothetical protein
MCLYCHFLPLENVVRYKNISHGGALLEVYDRLYLTSTQGSRNIGMNVSVIGIAMLY